MGKTSDCNVSHNSITTVEYTKPGKKRNEKRAREKVPVEESFQLKSILTLKLIISNNHSDTISMCYAYAHIFIIRLISLWMRVFHAIYT